MTQLSDALQKYQSYSSSRDSLLTSIKSHFVLLIQAVATLRNLVDAGGTQDSITQQQTTVQTLRANIASLKSSLKILNSEYRNSVKIIESSFNVPELSITKLQVDGSRGPTGPPGSVLTVKGSTGPPGPTGPAGPNGAANVPTDAAPTQGSSNLVSSGGVYASIQQITGFSFGNITYGSVLNSDPYTLCLFHFDGNDGDTCVPYSSSLEAPVSLAFCNANARLSSSIAKFGTTSLDVTSAASTLNCVKFNSAVTLGTQDFTAEAWIYTPNKTGTKRIFSLPKDGLGNVVVSLWINGSTLCATINGTNVQSNLDPNFPINTWAHVACCRYNGTLSIYFNGTLRSSGTATTQFMNSTYAYSSEYLIGGCMNSNHNFKGYIDEVRVSVGVARYTANFTPQSSPFPSPYGVPNVVSGTQGQLFTDGKWLFVCTASGSPGTWKVVSPV